MMEPLESHRDIDRVQWISSSAVLARLEPAAAPAAVAVREFKVSRPGRRTNVAARLADLRRLARIYRAMKIERQTPLSLSFAG